MTILRKKIRTIKFVKIIFWYLIFVKKNMIEIKNTINIFCAEKNKLIKRKKIVDEKKLINRLYKFNLIFILTIQSILSDILIFPVD